MHRPIHRALDLMAAAVLLPVLLTVQATAQDQQAAPARETVVHIKTQPDVALCVTGQRVPDGVHDFRVDPAVYVITAFGPGRPRTVTMLDVEAAPPEVTLELPAPPPVDGHWTGSLGGAGAVMDIVAGPCDQPACEIDDARPEGLSGTLHATVDGVPGVWDLRHFDWVDDKHVLACSALASTSGQSVAAAATLPDFSLWLVMDASGALAGSFMSDADLDNAALWSDSGEAETDADGALANPVDEMGDPVDRSAAFVR